MKLLWILLLIFSLFLIEPRLASQRLSLHLEKIEKVTVSDFFFGILGELRYTLASYIWLNTEIYHHELGLVTESSAVGKADPQKVGEILAICRLVTRLDPKFLEAYEVGSWRLGKGLGKFPEAVAFLQEGIAGNPESARLYEDLGEIYFFYRKDYGRATLPLKKVVELTQDKIEKERAYRMLAVAYEKTGHWKKAFVIYNQLLSIHPGDIVIQNRIKKLKRN